MTNDFRIAELEKDLVALQQDAKVIPVMAEQIVALRRDVEDGREENKSIRRTLIGFCVSLALAAIGMAFAVVQLLPGAGS